MQAGVARPHHAPWTKGATRPARPNRRGRPSRITQAILLSQARGNVKVRLEELAAAAPTTPIGTEVAGVTQRHP